MNDEPVIIMLQLINGQTIVGEYCKTSIELSGNMGVGLKNPVRVTSIDGDLFLVPNNTLSKLTTQVFNNSTIMIVDAPNDTIVKYYMQYINPAIKRYHRDTDGVLHSVH